MVEDLTYIYEQLFIYYDSLSCDTVLLRQDGKIKIDMLCYNRSKAKFLIRL